MKPMLLEKHDHDFGRIRELIPAELDAIAGGNGSDHETGHLPERCDTILMTVNGDGDFCAGCDECPS